MTACISSLPDVACIAVRGADARQYLHAQLTQDVASLGAARAPLAGWLDPRGRARALFRVVPLAEGCLLLTPRDTLAALVPRLRMYVLRAAVAVDAADDSAVAAVLDGGDWLAARGLAASAPRDAVAEHGGVRFVRVSADYALAVGPRALLAALGESAATAPTGAAELAEIGLGLPAVTMGVAERYVAQMLNLDCLDAIAFDKGCYPGQEIVARVHNLGSVKRRMRRYSVGGAAAPAPGAEIVSADGAAVGEVVRVAGDARRIELLAVVEHDAAATPLRAAPGLALTLEPLPYAVPAR
jgi:folate-binding protein YgfZ